MKHVFIVKMKPTYISNFRQNLLYQQVQQVPVPQHYSFPSAPLHYQQTVSVIFVLESFFQLVTTVPFLTLSQTNPGFYVSAVHVF